MRAIASTLNEIAHFQDLPGGTVLTLKLAAATAVASLVALVPASSAFAAYEDPAIDVEVHPTTLVGGGSISGTATSNGVDCAWTVTFLDQIETGTGTEIDFTFDTPEVDEETEEDVTVRCVYDDENIPQAAPEQAGTVNVQPASYSTTSAMPTALQTLTRTVTITLLPEGDDDDDDDGDGDGNGDGDDNGGLPDTGGIDQTIVLAGVALLAAGTGVVLMARRRRDGSA